MAKSMAVGFQGSLGRRLKLVGIEPCMLVYLQFLANVIGTVMTNQSMEEGGRGKTSIKLVAAAWGRDNLSRSIHECSSRCNKDNDDQAVDARVFQHFQIRSHHQLRTQLDHNIGLPVGAPCWALKNWESQWAWRGFHLARAHYTQRSLLGRCQPLFNWIHLPCHQDGISSQIWAFITHVQLD